MPNIIFYVQHESTKYYGHSILCGKLKKNPDISVLLIKQSWNLLDKVLKLGSFIDGILMVALFTDLKSRQVLALAGNIPLLCMIMVAKYSRVEAGWGWVDLMG